MNKRMFWSFQWGRTGMKRRGGFKLLNIPVSLFTGFQAAIMPWFAFNGDREESWILIPLSLYLTWTIVFLMKIRPSHNPYFFLIVHLVITTLYLPGIISAYNSYAVTSVILALLHLYYEYFSRTKPISVAHIPSRVYRNKRRVTSGRHPTSTF